MTDAEIAMKERRARATGSIQAGVLRAHRNRPWWLSTLLSGLSLATVVTWVFVAGTWHGGVNDKLDHLVTAQQLRDAGTDPQSRVMEERFKRVEARNESTREDINALREDVRAVNGKLDQLLARAGVAHER